MSETEPKTREQARAQLDALTKAARDTKRFAQGASERAAGIRVCLTALETGDDDAAACFERMPDPPTRRILQAHYAKGGRDAALQAAHALYAEARERAEQRQEEAERLEHLRLDARSVYDALQQSV